jgi:hypothetical protein
MTAYRTDRQYACADYRTSGKRVELEAAAQLVKVQNSFRFWRHNYLNVRWLHTLACVVPEHNRSRNVILWVVGSGLRSGPVVGGQRAKQSPAGHSRVEFLAERTGFSPLPCAHCRMFPLLSSARYPSKIVLIVIIQDGRHNAESRWAPRPLVGAPAIEADGICARGNDHSGCKVRGIQQTATSAALFVGR